jgi:predicted MFS family arabinose efflux permease|tara:strand:- start:49773 stop:51080 length:1308 start_codon:yes stop_codon:yes gene_type:complete
VTGQAAAPQARNTQSGPWDLYSVRQRKGFLFVLFLTGTSNYADRHIVGVLLEPIKAEFGVSDTMLGLLTGIAFALFYVIVGLPVAWLADRGNRQKIIVWSLAVWSIMTLFCGMAQSFLQLALARIGVGAGEAGAVPPAQSLIADYFPPEQRAGALGFYMTSATAGYFVGMVLGGWIAQTYGWREAFIVVGLPGLLLALITRFTLKEPRAIARFSVAREALEDARTSITKLLAKPSYRNIVYALILYYLMAYGALVFTISLLIRVHELSIAEAGGLFGAIMAIGSVIGNVGGGMLIDRLAKRDMKLVARFPGALFLLALPVYVCAFMLDHIIGVVILLFIGAIVLAVALLAIFAAMHTVCGSKRRAMAVALAFFFANLFGLGAGPVMAGALSDYMGVIYGVADGLRYALIIMCIFFVPAGIFMNRASRQITNDAEA